MSESTGATLSPQTGWEADAPEDDTILRRFLLSQADYQRALGEAIGATIIDDERVLAVDTGRAASMVNFALLRQPLDGTALDEVMAQLNALFLQPGAKGWVACYCPLPTPDLSPYGWTLAGHPRLELRAPQLPILEVPPARIEPVRTAEELAIHEQLLIDGFGMDDMRGLPPGSMYGTPLLGDSRFRAWIAYLDGQPAATASSFTSHGIVDVVMVATAPAARRKGLGLAVTQVATRPELGFPAVLFSSDEGRPVYEKLGFVPILRGSFWYRER